MITKISGVLTEVRDEEARLQVGPLEYQVLISESVRRSLQMRVGEEITFRTVHYFEGNPTQGRTFPRLIGFTTAAELDLFDLLCSVDKVGARKALKAMSCAVSDIANAIQREDAKWLTSLPGIGASTAEQMIAKLKRKVTRLSVATPTRAREADDASQAASVDAKMIEDAYKGLLNLGLSPLEARTRIDQAIQQRMDFATVEEILEEIFRSKT